MTNEQKQTPSEQAAPAAIAPNETTQTVYLPGLLSDEYGMARSQCRMIIATGTVTIDGVQLEDDEKFDIPYEKAKSGEIHVSGQTHSFRLTYRG